MPKHTTRSSKSPATVLGSEDSFRLLVESVKDYAIVMLDPDGHVVSWNAGAERIKGYKAEEIIGEHFSCFYPAEAIERGVPEQELKTAAKDGRFEDEGWRVRKDGKQFWANVIISALRDKDGTLRGFSKVTRDLTERKQAELLSGETTVQLQRMSSELEIIIDAIPGLVFYKDVNNRFLRVNKYMADAYKKTKKQLEGASCFDLHSQKEAQAYFDDDLQVIRSRTPKLGIDERFETESGVSWVSTSKIPYFDEKGDVVGVIGVSLNITERKLAEERIQQQTKEIMDLSTPVMQVWQGVVVAPLIGSLDSQRTQQFMERLLGRIVETNSPVALVDIMGVPTIDTQTAQHLIETISAVRLLGAQVVLTGVRPAIAQTLVHLGIDLSGIMTRASLSAGLQVALDILNLTVVRKDDSR
jgi:PAS domain S-box-containing protein